MAQYVGPHRSKNDLNRFCFLHQKILKTLKYAGNASSAEKTRSSIKKLFLGKKFRSEYVETSLNNLLEALNRIKKF